MSLNKAIVGFVIHKLAEGLTDRSVSSYERLLTKWVIHTGDNDINQVAYQDIRSYLAWLRTDYQPRRFNGQTHLLSPKTIRNIWVTLASCFKWTTMEFSIPNPMDGIPAPRFQQAPVQVFTKAEVELVLKACAYTREADTTFRRSYTYHRPTARCERSIILTLLDTGLRAMELCSLNTGNLDLVNGTI
jgi:integrase/recombinase XerD